MSLERYYRFHARLYDATRWSFLFGRRRILDQVLACSKPSRVLEIGCGTGANLALLRARLPGASLTGVDLSEDMLAVARRKLDARAVKLVHGRYPETAPEGPFDLVLFSYALTMFNPGWERALEAARDSLAPSGLIAVVDFHDTRFASFRRWMALNHVRVEGQILPWLDEAFPDATVSVRPAFLGTWLYFSFLAPRSA